ncbi:MAG: GNAT family N-acetyltransferase [Caldilineaceae bacterium]|nr:GNAT family N-acetyltransferase [Caldilineaceae bacterium]
MRIVPLAACHAARAARLHEAGQPGTFLTSLGPGVLTALYRALPATTAGFGFAAPAGDASEKDAPVDAPPLGFVAAATSVGRLFVQVGPRLLPPLAARLARQPGLLARCVQTAAYPLLVREPDVTATAELLAIMVDPAHRSQGIGAALLDALVAECRGRAIARLDVTVDAVNYGAQRFYERHGFQPQRRFTLYSRAMLLYGLDLAQHE